MSISGPYRFPEINNSGAAYSGEPQWVCNSSLGLHLLLRPKSLLKKIIFIIKLFCLVLIFNLILQIMKNKEFLLTCNFNGLPMMIQ